jgi:hypothetical protein
MTPGNLSLTDIGPPRLDQRRILRTRRQAKRDHADGTRLDKMKA